MKQAHDVFGISTEVLPDSYVDRGALDVQLQRLLERDRKHIALRGASKCGKSWLRRKVVPNPIVVQCRLGKTVLEVYVDALSQLEIDLTVETVGKNTFRGSVKATGSMGVALLGKLGLDVAAEASTGKDTRSAPVGRDINDLRYVADLLKAAGRKLVIEDFHYLSVDERRKFAFDLKSFWDWGLNVVIIGVWSQDNMLLSLNPDLAGRMEEISITWNEQDLGRILDKGGEALNIRFLPPLRRGMVDISFGNAGILQWLALAVLDEVKIQERGKYGVDLSEASLLQTVAMEYAEQLNPLYQEFARGVSEGIRTRKNSTGIYAHTMAIVMQATDEQLIGGIDAGTIYAAASARQPRIQLSNLKAILLKLDELQVDDGGRGLVLTYNPATEKVSVVDRQLLLYRKYATVKWPWDDLIEEAGDDAGKFHAG